MACHDIRGFQGDSARILSADGLWSVGVVDDGVATVLESSFCDVFENNRASTGKTDIV